MTAFLCIVAIEMLQRNKLTRQLQTSTQVRDASPISDFELSMGLKVREEFRSRRHKNITVRSIGRDSRMNLYDDIEFYFLKNIYSVTYPLNIFLSYESHSFTK